MNTYRLMKTYQVKQIAEQAKAEGYEVIEANESLIIKLDNREVLRALIHSSGKNYLVIHTDNFLTEVKK